MNEEIVEDVLQEREESESENEDEASSNAVTLSQACAAFDTTALEWLEFKGNTHPAHLMLVKSWRDDAAQRSLKSMKQTKITSYFKSIDSCIYRCFC